MAQTQRVLRNPSDEVRDRLRDLPPSAKLVVWVLDDQGPLTAEQVTEESLLPSRTVRYALNRLQDVELVCLRNPSQESAAPVYYLDM